MPFSFYYTMDNLQTLWKNLAGQFSNDLKTIDNCWDEIITRYNEPHRHYHTLDHINDIFNKTFSCKIKIANPNILWFSIFYHDVIYNPDNHDNEQKSADFAYSHLKQLKVPQNMVIQCQGQILATKNHTASNNNNDTNLLLDLDISILGESDTIYEKYCNNIRAEYQKYPEKEYQQGRIKVLQHFLNRDRIYWTHYFYDIYEKKARANMMNELAIIHS